MQRICTLRILLLNEATVLRHPSPFKQDHSTRIISVSLTRTKQTNKETPAKHEVASSQTFLQLKGTAQPFVDSAALSDLEIN